MLLTLQWNSWWLLGGGGGALAAGGPAGKSISHVYNADELPATCHVHRLPCRSSSSPRPSLLQSLLLCTGMGPVRPNTVLLPWSLPAVGHCSSHAAFQVSIERIRIPAVNSLCISACSSLEPRRIPGTHIHITIPPPELRVNSFSKIPAVHTLM